MSEKPQPGDRPPARLAIEEVRRMNLRDRVTKYGGTQESFAKVLGVSPGRLSQLVRAGSTERFTEDTARKFEQALGLQHGSMSRASTQDQEIPLEWATVINSAIFDAALAMKVLPTEGQMGELFMIAVNNARKTGAVDREMVVSVSRALLARETGKGTK